MKLKTLLFIVALLIGLVVLFKASTVAYVAAFNTATEFKALEVTRPIMVPDALDTWLDRRLRLCESGGNDEAINPHDGGSRSVGRFQIKDTTWAGWTKRYYPEFTAEDIEDGEKQHLVVKAVLTNEPKAYLAWKNCTTNPTTHNFAGLPPKIN